MPRDTDISKFMSLVLRHQPEAAGLILDENGWTPVDTLVAALQKRFGIGRDDLLRIVMESPKQRFTIEGRRIRAAQGHSVAVDLGHAPSTPPSLLYHGTSAASMLSILAGGLSKQARQHVHLSADVGTARIVAARRQGARVVLSVDAGRMAKDGLTFYLSENGVWLTDSVAPAYLAVIEESPT